MSIINEKKNETEDHPDYVDLDKSHEFKESGLEKTKYREIQRENGFENAYEKLSSLEDLFLKMEEIDSNSKTLLFFDIQGVLIKNNHNHEALASKTFEKILYEICEHHGEEYTKIARYGRFFQVELTTKKLPAILEKLKKKNREFSLLTFAKYSKDRENALRDHQILHFFEKQIWTGGIKKGLVIVQYLNSKSSTEPINIVFVDDKINHLKSAYEALSKEKLVGRNSIGTIHLFHHNPDPVTSVLESEFRNYWEMIIRKYKESLNLKQNRKNYYYK